MSSYSRFASVALSGIRVFMLSLGLRLSGGRRGVAVGGGYFYVNLRAVGQHIRGL